MKKDQDQLGHLELAVMHVLWSATDSLDVKDVVARLGGSRAYTTVMTTLARLHKKGYLEQEKNGRSYRYSPRVSRKSVLQRMIVRLADYFFNGDVGKLVPQIHGMEKELSPGERRRLRAASRRIKDFDAE